MRYLDEQTSKFEAIISTRIQQIAKLEELKTKLIADVVTGKIDVRGIEIPEYEYTAEESAIDSEEDTDDLDEGADDE